MTVINITDDRNKIMSHQNRNIESLQYFYRGLDGLNNHTIATTMNSPRLFYDDVDYTTGMHMNRICRYRLGRLGCTLKTPR